MKLGGTALKVIGMMAGLGSGAAAGSLLSGQALSDKAKRDNDQKKAEKAYLDKLQKQLSTGAGSSTRQTAAQRRAASLNNYRFGAEVNEIRAAGGLHGYKTTKLTVGEAGPEFVMAIPLHGKTGAKTTMNGNVLKAAGGFMGAIGKSIGMGGDKHIESIDKNIAVISKNISILTKTMSGKSAAGGPSVSVPGVAAGGLIKTLGGAGAENSTTSDVIKANIATEGLKRIAPSLTKIAKSPAMKVGGAAVAGLTAAYAGYNDEEMAGQSEGRKLGVAGTAGVGGAGGALAGMAIGTAIMPVVGTIIGGILGGLAGGFIGKEGGKALLKDDSIPSFAKGGSFTTTGEQLIRVGEAGAENVTITPAGQSNLIPNGGSGDAAEVVIKEDQSKIAKEQLKRLKDGKFKTEDEAASDNRSWWQKLFGPKEEIIKAKDYENAAGNGGAGAASPAGNMGGTGKMPTISSNTTAGQNLVTAATPIIGMPYHMGSKGGDGQIDCSGATSSIYKRLGADVTGSADMQFKQAQKEGRMIGGLAGAEIGDTIFFNNGRLGGGAADHVGIYAGTDPEGNPLMLHASSKGGKTDIYKMAESQRKNIIGVASAPLAAKQALGVQSKPSYNAGVGVPSTTAAAQGAIGAGNKDGGNVKGQFDQSMLPQSETGGGGAGITNNTAVSNTSSSGPSRTILSSRVPSVLGKMSAVVHGG
jgi:cell wall-associated NlpC family hydrolase